MNHIILFDGKCNFCDRSVQFILKRDKKAIYKFASLQSEAGKEVLNRHKVPGNIDSLVYVENEKYYLKSSAALRICKHLSGGWKFFYLLLMIPKPLRDFVYKIIAKNRYKWFGKKDRCMLPSQDTRSRFL